VDTLSRATPNNVRVVRGEPETAHRWASAARSALQDVGEATLGMPVVTHRTSWVRLVQIDGSDYFVKTYRYQGAFARGRAWRWTAPWRRTRVSREYDALAWMRANGFEAPEPVAALEWRHLGFACQATLITRRWPGTNLADLLPQLDPEQRLRLAEALGRAIRALHEAGFRDGNLDLRNLLAAGGAPSWRIAKLDSPRFRLRTPGDRWDRWRRRDLARLRPQLADFGLVDAVWRQFP
jgi:hypothetical protein